jgi:hypothetical protein
MAQKQKDEPKLRIDFEGLIAKGAMNGHDGFASQTANGTAQWRGTGRNKNGVGGWQNVWEGFSTPEVESDPVRRKGRNNRTGE